jgi:hypothetical protein
MRREKKVIRKIKIKRCRVTENTNKETLTYTAKEPLPLNPSYVRLNNARVHTSYHIDRQKHMSTEGHHDNAPARGPGTIKIRR